jgi:hypothetical protein
MPRCARLGIVAPSAYTVIAASSYGTTHAYLYTDILGNISGMIDTAGAIAAG